MSSASTSPVTGTASAEILDGPEDRVYGQRELVVKDCNGLILAFGEANDTPPDAS